MKNSVNVTLQQSITCTMSKSDFANAIEASSKLEQLIKSPSLEVSNPNLKGLSKSLFLESLEANIVQEETSPDSNYFTFRADVNASVSFDFKGDSNISQRAEKVANTFINPVYDFDHTEFKKDFSYESHQPLEPLEKSNVYEMGYN